MLDQKAFSKVVTQGHGKLEKSWNLKTSKENF